MRDNLRVLRSYSDQVPQRTDLTRCATSHHVSDHAASSSSMAFACFKSGVPKPSVNQP